MMEEEEGLTEWGDVRVLDGSRCKNCTGSRSTQFGLVLEQAEEVVFDNVWRDPKKN